MADLTTVAAANLEIYSALCAELIEKFNYSPKTATKRLQKKALRWAKKQLRLYGLLNGVPFVAESEILPLLFACYRAEQKREKEQQQLFKKNTKAFSAEVKSAFLQIFELEPPVVETLWRPGELALVLESNPAYKKELVLQLNGEIKNREQLHQLYLCKNVAALCFFNAKVVCLPNGYQLACTALNFETDVETELEIYFSAATVKTQLFKAQQQPFLFTPWETLSQIAIDLLAKNELGPQYFNAKERALLPLLNELAALTASAWMENSPKNFAVLKRYAEKHFFKRVCRALKKAEQKLLKPPKKATDFAKIIGLLNAAEGEPLWREVYLKISESQQDYFDQTAFYSGPALEKTRRQITEKLQSLGYKGSYPLFCKTGVIKGFGLVESYNQSYFVSPKSAAQYFVYCTENVFYQKLQIQFISATAFFKKNNRENNAFSCCFNAKGKRLFKTVTWQEEFNAEPAEYFAAIAAKRAECKPLTRAEKSKIGLNGLTVTEFLLIFVLAGLGFAVLNLAFYLLLCSFVTLVAFGAGSVPEMLNLMPWGAIFAFCFLGFGGGMALFYALAKNK